MLELDVGNTRMKWRFIGAQGQDDLAGVVLGRSLSLDFLPEQLTPQRVRISCVRDHEYQVQLSAAVESRWSVVPEFAETKVNHAGLVVAYAEPKRLGVDRWLAMLAAQELASGRFCVVDAGSALTVDFVASTGRHLGGYIVPGLALQKKSLLENTAIRIPEFSMQAQLCPGSSTESAIHNGILGMTVAWIVEECRERLEGGQLYLTGGDAPVIAAHLQNKAISCSLVPELVMDGLRLALP